MFFQYAIVLVHKWLVFNSMVTGHVGNKVEFNISWLRGGHPALSVRDLSIEASQSLGSLLDQLRFPTVNSLSNSMVVVLINR